MDRPRPDQFTLLPSGLYIPNPSEQDGTQLEAIVQQTLMGIQKDWAHQDGMFALMEDCPEFFEYASTPGNPEKLGNYVILAAMATMRDLYIDFPYDEATISTDLRLHGSQILRDEYYNGLSRAYLFGRNLGNITGTDSFKNIQTDHWETLIQQPQSKVLTTTQDHETSALTRLEALIERFPAVLPFLRYMQKEPKLTIPSLRKRLTGTQFAERNLILYAHLLGYADMITLQENGYTALYQRVTNQPVDNESESAR